MRFHVEEAGADAKLIQHGPLGVAYHRRHPISTVPVARITAHATVPGFLHVMIVLGFGFWVKLKMFINEIKLCLVNLSKLVKT